MGASTSQRPVMRFFVYAKCRIFNKDVLPLYVDASIGPNPLEGSAVACSWEVNQTCLPQLQPALGTRALVVQLFSDLRAHTFSGHPGRLVALEVPKQLAKRVAVPRYIGKCYATGVGTNRFP